MDSGFPAPASQASGPGMTVHNCKHCLNHAAQEIIADPSEKFTVMRNDPPWRSNETASRHSGGRAERGSPESMPPACVHGFRLPCACFAVFGPRNDGA